MKLLFLFVTLFNLQAFSAINVKLAKTIGRSNFLAIGNPSAIRIEGQGEAPEGDLNVVDQGANWILSGTLHIDLKSYSTGIALRDRHMKDKYLEVDKYQMATLNIEALQVQKVFLAKETESNIPFKGLLTLHGVSKNVEGELSVKKLNAKIQVSSKFTLKLSDYSVDVPSFAGIKVADSVEVKTVNEIESF